MEQNGLFPLKYRLRKTDELVEIVAWETAEKGARNENDWVSYIDSSGVEHIKEHLTLEWDFVIDSPFEKIISGGFGGGLDKYDPWDARRYELVKQMYFDDDFWRARNIRDIDDLVKVADTIIDALKKPQEAVEFVQGVQQDDGYETIGIGEIVEDSAGLMPIRKFVFTDRKDIVGFKGDNGRWAVGDKVKVYIKKIEPKKGL